MTRKYWKGLDELQETPAFVESRDREFPESVTVDEFLGDESLNENAWSRVYFWNHRSNRRGHTLRTAANEAIDRASLNTLHIRSGFSE